MITHDVMTGGMMNSYCREIMQVEGAFCSLAQEVGVKRAFLTYAAEDAVIHRDGKLFRGHAGIEEYFDASLIEIRRGTSKRLQVLFTPCGNARPMDAGYSSGIEGMVSRSR